MRCCDLTGAPSGSGSRGERGAVGARRPRGSGETTVGCSDRAMGGSLWHTGADSIPGMMTVADFSMVRIEWAS